MGVINLNKEKESAEKILEMEKGSIESIWLRFISNNFINSHGDVYAVGSIAAEIIRNKEYGPYVDKEAVKSYVSDKVKEEYFRDRSKLEQAVITRGIVQRIIGQGIPQGVYKLFKLENIEYAVLTYAEDTEVYPMNFRVKLKGISSDIEIWNKLDESYRNKQAMYYHAAEILACDKTSIEFRRI